MRVRSGSCYTFRPASWDLFDKRAPIQPGALVRVKSLPGCPPANTMGHAHVVHPTTGAFLGLVCTASLVRE